MSEVAAEAASPLGRIYRDEWNGKWRVLLPASSARMLRFTPLVQASFPTKRAARAFVAKALDVLRGDPCYVNGTVFADEAVRDLERLS